ncbi:MAG: SapC family protein [Litorivicinus sp.]
MEKQLLIYSDVKPVTKADHGQHSLKGTGELGFAREVNSVPLTLPEMPMIAHELPIVFTGGDSVVPAVIMGMRDGENLVINAEGKWQGRYVPAFLRRYPFVFSKVPEADRFTLCIDESYAGWNTDNKGERLFDGDGEQTQYLQGVLNFLQEYQAHFTQTQTFCDRLQELDLLEPVTANFQFDGGERQSLGGFMAVNRAKLKALPQEQLLGMLSRDELELIYLHLFSMNRFNHLIELAGASNASAQDDQVH